jgi:hypothetical protein
LTRYFLHLRDGEHLIRDLEGRDLPDLAAARTEAIQGARDILAEMLRAGEVLDGQSIAIADADDNVLDVVTFKSLVKLG